MSEQTITLHIGRGKTGTTALRRHFARHAGILARHGIAYPGAAGADEGNGHDTFGKAFIDPRPSYMTPPRDPEAALRDLAEQIRATDLPKILLLSEQLEMADPAAVRRYLDGIGDYRFRILFVLRSQDELAESEFNQLARYDPGIGTLTAFAETLFNGDFHATAAAWADVFGAASLTCAVYDAAAPRVLAQVLDALDAPGALAEMPALPAVNRSVPFQALTAIRMLNRLDLPDRRKLYRRILEAETAAPLPALYFDAAGAAAFRARYSASNRALGRRFLGREVEDLGGRRYDDAERDEIRRAILALRLDRA